MGLLYAHVLVDQLLELDDQPYIINLILVKIIERSLLTMLHPVFPLTSLELSTSPGYNFHDTCICVDYLHI